MCERHFRHWPVHHRGKMMGYTVLKFAEPDDVRLVSFPFSLNRHSLASLRAYEACDAANGIQPDPYIAAELARA